MANEIERKFLLKNNTWPHDNVMKYRQGYLSSVKERNVRVRIAGEKGWLTIKGSSVGASRMEFEYEIPLQDAGMLLDICEKPLIEKNRYKVIDNGFTWEVDEFFGENQGLVIAEIELESEDQEFTKPDWIGEEVTDDPRYYNASLVKNPFKMW
ncbi:MAG: CYTH domain-containing protein [Deltaproteobacteria bacterium]|nr:CYTH domain-containing protein [Deltaproteobacteria bacterium]